MLSRSCLGAFLSAGLVLFAGCAASDVDSIQVSPTTQSITAGQTVQFTATGSVGHGSHPSSTENVTNQVTWSSSAPSVATVSASGLATAVAAGSTTITATMPGFGGQISATAALTVTAASSPGGPTSGTITALNVIPGTQSVAAPSQTSQFIAIGTTSSGATVNLTNQVSWGSSSVQIATINSAGLATAVGQGTTTITAIATNADHSVVTGTASFMVTGGTQEQITALTIIPGSQAATAAAQKSQFFVLGTQGSNGLQYDVTSNPSLTWTSSNATVATVCSYGASTPCTSSTAGQVTAVGAGATTITATWTNLDSSKVTATANYSVTIGAAQEPLLSINVVPAGVTVSNQGMTGQYLAFGTYSTTPTVRDITNEVTWVSLLPEVASINSGGVNGEPGGLATAMGYTGSSVIYAEGPPRTSPDGNPDGTVVISNPQTFTCKDPVKNDCEPGPATPQFATITVFVEGENTTPGYVTAPNGNGMPNLIHCGPGWTGSGGQVCTGTYLTGSTVALTETGSTFGGWSSGTGCAKATTCTVTLNGNTSVGAIFY